MKKSLLILILSSILLISCGKTGNLYLPEEPAQEQQQEQQQEQGK